MDETEFEQAEATTPVSRPRWKRWMGNCEGLLALFCLIWIFRPGYISRGEIPWQLYITMALGFGFSIGGIRFGGTLGRPAGLVALVCLSILMLIILVTSIPYFF
jgi:hypothetical protein